MKITSLALSLLLLASTALQAQTPAPAVKPAAPAVVMPPQPPDVPAEKYGKDGKINGWQGRAELVLEGRDFARITATAGKIQTLTISQVAFGLSREARAKVESKAQTQAIEQFKARAAELAKGFGFANYSLREVAVNSNEMSPGPRPRMMAAEAKVASFSDSAVPVEAGKAQVTVNVSGSVQMR